MLADIDIYMCYLLYIARIFLDICIRYVHHGIQYANAVPVYHMPEIPVITVKQESFEAGNFRVFTVSDDLVAENLRNFSQTNLTLL